MAAKDITEHNKKQKVLHDEQVKKHETREKKEYENTKAEQLRYIWQWDHG